MIHKILKAGEENALSPDYLRVTLGCKNNRAVQKQIEKERGQGKVILSSTISQEDIIFQIHLWLFENSV